MLRYLVICRYLHTSRACLNTKPGQDGRVSPNLASIIRVDHAGELGADRIYAGQMAVLGHTKVGPTIQEMWDQEKDHKARFEALIVKHRVRPTVLHPIWTVAGYVLGAGTALMGEKAAMACTVAVESVIVDHYNDQLRTLMAEENPDKELMETIKKCRDEEQEHHDCGLDHGAEQAPFYKALTQVIKAGCKAAIAASKGLLAPPNGPCLAFSRNYSTPAKTSRWDLLSAVCLERKPIITKPLTPLEVEYQKALAEIELAGSMLSDHELRLQEDAKRAELLKNSDVLDDTELDAALKQSAQDFEDACTEELTKFELAPRSGKNDGKSLKRKLDLHLVLLTKFKLGTQEVWGLPQDIRKEDETLRNTADRVITQFFGPQLKISILGNAPFGFFKYKYPVDSRQQSVGAKLFFFKGIYLSGDVVLNKNVAIDYQWVTRSEFEKTIVNAQYLRSIQAFLIDEVDENVEKVASSSL